MRVMLAADAIAGLGLKNVGIMTDGRFSGFNHGLIIGHVSLEAAIGGTIALVEDGDIPEMVK